MTAWTLPRSAAIGSSRPTTASSSRPAGTTTGMGWVGDLQPYLDRLDAKSLWSTLPIVVVIDDGNGYRSIYAHLSKADVKAGDAVSAGELIGYEGKTGRASGCHLHYGLFSPLEPDVFGIDPGVVERMLLPAWQIARVDPQLVLPSADDRPRHLRLGEPTPATGAGKTARPGRLADVRGSAGRSGRSRATGRAPGRAAGPTSRRASRCASRGCSPAGTSAGSRVDDRRGRSRPGPAPGCRARRSARPAGRRPRTRRGPRPRTRQLGRRRRIARHASADARRDAMVARPRCRRARCAASVPTSSPRAHRAAWWSRAYSSRSAYAASRSAGDPSPKIARIDTPKTSARSRSIARTVRWK